MRVAFPNQIREIDRRCAAEYDVPELKLMENAGRNVFLETVAFLKRQHRYQEGMKAVCVCGKGNNGGDGFVAARYFLNYGWDAEIFVCASELDPGSAFTNYQMLENMDAPITWVNEETFPEFRQVIARADVIVDGLFGTGLRSEVRGLQAKIIREINAANGASVVSIDIPSGIDGGTGCVQGVAVKADLTVCMAVAKAGNLLYPGKEYGGELMITEIGVPQELLSDVGIKTFETEGSLVKSFFPKRDADSNKGTYGRVGIITGSLGMTGAGILAGRAALRTGAGLVYLIVPNGLSAIYECASQETVTIPVGQAGATCFTEEEVPQVLAACRQLDTIVLGPGMGTAEETLGFVQSFLRAVDTLPNCEEQVLILDADALNLLSTEVDLLREVHTTKVLTPHPGEMARLYGAPVKEIQKDRIQVAKSFAEAYETILVLKGAVTVTALPDGTVYLNPTGNPGMATAGSGDVLCGVLSAMTACGRDLDTVVPCGVYLHGLAGDLAASTHGEYSMVAGDITAHLGQAILRIQEETE